MLISTLEACEWFFMALLQRLLDFLVNTNQYLESFTQQYGLLVYFVLFLIIFCESGFLVGCFLPGDSLLFTAGFLAGTGVLDFWPLLILLTVATIAGYSLNYWQGTRTGPHLFTQKHKRFFKKEHMEKTHQYVEKYGARVIIVARFIGFVRTFAPFVAGMGNMCPWRFNLCNAIGGVLWIGGCVSLGYFLFDNPLVRKFFS